MTIPPRRRAVGVAGSSVAAVISRPLRWLTWAMPSAIRLVPMVKIAMISTGASTAQGWVDERRAGSR